jgi:hypothetical protein
MNTEIENFIAQENPELLVRIAEEIGHDLGMTGTSQFTGVYRTISAEINRCLYLARDKKDSSSIVLLKPKLALAAGRFDFRLRPAFEKFHHAFIDGVDCILQAQGEESYKRLKRFDSFIEAIFCYQQYALSAGARSYENPETKRLRDRINAMQLEMNKLLQFVSASTKQAKVFLSHAHIDKPFVEKLKSDLENRGITTWYDNRDLEIGDIISDVISQGVKQSWCFLIVVSPQSVNSRWVKYELDEAYDQHISKGKRILPVLTGNLSDDDIPQRLKKHLYADFRNSSKYGEAFDRLYRTIVKEGAKGLSLQSESAVIE